MIGFKDEYSTSLVLDKRRAVADGRFPVKVCVYETATRKAKYYKTKFYFTEEEFKSVWESKKPRKEHSPKRKAMKGTLDYAEGLAGDIVPFNFEEFELKLGLKRGEGSNIFYHFEQKIKTLKAEERIGTASLYDLTEKALKNYLKYKTGKEVSRLTFQEITVDWLNKFEQWFTNIEGNGLTACGIYLRNVRALFNDARETTKDIPKDLYPFGKRKYVIPAGRSVKKALNRQQLKLLIEAQATEAQAEARDYFFLSYTMQGVNMADIARFKYGDMQGGVITFTRQKTKRTTKGKALLPIQVPLTEFALRIIEKYGNPNTGPDQYIFPILQKGMTAQEQHGAVRNKIKSLNTHIKKLATTAGVEGNISYYYGRHSYATGAIREGASMEMVSGGLGHTDTSTTKHYFAGFEDEANRQLLEKLINFE